MDLIIQRLHRRSDGIFSVVTDSIGHQVFVSLEHAYRHADGSFHPIVQPGVYTCRRGLHRLPKMENQFETFEIMGVKGHSGILWHWGNWNDNSSGCVLTGSTFMMKMNPKHNNEVEKMITQSRETFSMFMELQKGNETFKVVVAA